MKPAELTKKITPALKLERRGAGPYRLGDEGRNDMDATPQPTEDFYKSGDYWRKNPTLHEEDAEWKFETIRPLLDRFAASAGQREVSILDVGGGTGLILKMAEAHLRRAGLAVRKTLLDLSPRALEIQKQNHPDARGSAAGSIAATGFGDRQFDLVMMIDVLEHVPQPEQALAEVKRISRHALLKVPLEDNLTLKLLNLATLGSFHRRVTLGVLGHVNCYSARTLTAQLQRAGGRVLEFRFTNAHRYLLHTPAHCRSLAHRMVFGGGDALFRLSPALAARVFNDFAVCLVAF